ncbi:precorrin-8X methylmutase [Shewanella youngdeokensis]|uniref:Precorrin-8X methylmutase n=1 Tax=Shewanella youngdeokensis TaxID=2999068 RepID=A0ABZ0K3Q7_9GAMM|nr:precorrin-8X methylmutase [Shewanella sp. DAU334]
MQQMKQMTTQGRNIETSSFSIIDAEVAEHVDISHLSDAQWNVVRRAIHTSGDFEYGALFSFSDNAMKAGIEAIRAGCPIISDVTMIKSGLSAQRMNVFGNKADCFISDADVIERAKESGGTRAVEAMRKARDIGLLDGAIVGIGNAPTALYEILRMVAENEIKPALIIGIPVGFVKAVESKLALTEQSDVDYIASMGRKGGSPLIVSSLHALMVEAAK